MTNKGLRDWNIALTMFLLAVIISLTNVINAHNDTVKILEQYALVNVDTLEAITEVIKDNSGRIENNDDLISENRQKINEIIENLG